MPVVTQHLGRVRATLDPRPNLAFARSFWGDVTAIRRLIREEAIDLVLIGGLANPQGAIAARLEGKPVVWQIVDSRTPRLLRLALTPLLRHLASAVMFNGESLIRLHGCQSLKQPCVVYYPPVDTALFKPSTELRQQTRQTYGIPLDAHLVGMVANFTPQKGIEYFVRAAAKINRELPGTYFMLVGAQYETHRGYEASVEAELAATGIERSHFIIAGQQDRVHELYPAFDVKLITSIPKSEGTTTTALEAQACGVPVIATDVGAVSEVVRAGETGFIVAALDPAGIARATIDILKVPEHREAMAGSAVEFARRAFDIEVCADVHAAALTKAVAYHESKLARKPGEIAAKGMEATKSD